MKKLMGYVVCKNASKNSYFALKIMDSAIVSQNMTDIVDFDGVNEI